MFLPPREKDDGWNWKEWFTLTDCSRTAQYTVGQNGNKYMRCNLKKNYDGAKAFCEQDNAHLVTISSQEEQDLVKALPG